MFAIILRAVVIQLSPHAQCGLIVEPRTAWRIGRVIDALSQGVKEMEDELQAHRISPLPSSRPPKFRGRERFHRRVRLSKFLEGMSHSWAMLGQDGYLPNDKCPSYNEIPAEYLRARIRDYLWVAEELQVFEVMLETIRPMPRVYAEPPPDNVVAFPLSQGAEDVP